MEQDKQTTAQQKSPSRQMLSFSVDRLLQQPQTSAGVQLKTSRRKSSDSTASSTPPTSPPIFISQPRVMINATAFPLPLGMSLPTNVTSSPVSTWSPGPFNTWSLIGVHGSKPGAGSTPWAAIQHTTAALQQAKVLQALQHQHSTSNTITASTSNKIEATDTAAVSPNSSKHAILCNIISSVLTACQFEGI